MLNTVIPKAAIAGLRNLLAAGGVDLPTAVSSSVALLPPGNDKVWRKKAAILLREWLTTPVQIFSLSHAVAP